MADKKPHIMIIEAPFYKGISEELLKGALIAKLLDDHAAGVARAADLPHAAGSARRADEVPAQLLAVTADLAGDPQQQVGVGPDLATWLRWVAGRHQRPRARSEPSDTRVSPRV